MGAWKNAARLHWESSERLGCAASSSTPAMRWTQSSGGCAFGVQEEKSKAFRLGLVGGGRARWRAGEASLFGVFAAELHQRRRSSSSRNGSSILCAVRREWNTHILRKQGCLCLRTISTNKLRDQSTWSPGFHHTSCVITIWRSSYGIHHDCRRSPGMIGQRGHSHLESTGKSQKNNIQREGDVVLMGSWVTEFKNFSSFGLPAWPRQPAHEITKWTLARAEHRWGASQLFNSDDAVAFSSNDRRPD